MGGVPSPRLLLIRHAESEWNARGLWQGWGDPPLSARGCEQAETLARQLGPQPRFDLLVSSDLCRARQTAEIVGRVWDVTPRDDARLRELSVGRWEARTRREIAGFDATGLERFDAGDPLWRAGGGESARDLARRVRPVIADYAERFAARRLAFVLHLGVLRVLLREPGALEHASCRACGLEALELDPDGPVSLV